MLVTAFVLLIFFDSRRSRSSMLRKSVLPPKLSWYVRSRRTPRSMKSRVSTRCVIVAPTCDLMSSPMIGRFFAAKRFCQYGSRAMKTGMQLMNAQPASRTCSTYHFVASSLPTGRYETTTSTWRSRRMPTMSSVAPGAFFTTCDRYLPIPSPRIATRILPFGRAAAGRGRAGRLVLSVCGMKLCTFLCVIERARRDGDALDERDERERRDRGDGDEVELVLAEERPGGEAEEQDDHARLAR